MDHRSSGNTAMRQYVDYSGHAHYEDEIWVTYGIKSLAEFSCRFCFVTLSRVADLRQARKIFVAKDTVVSSQKRRAMILL